MITLIPLHYYAPLFFNFILATIFFCWIDAVSSPLTSPRNLNKKIMMGYFTLLFVLIYIGFRPVSGRYFGDMRTYANHFNNYADGYQITTEKDITFHLFMKASAKVMSLNMFFLVCAALYILPLYSVSKRLFKKYWFYSFLILIASLSFWAFGTNGIRNGIATSIILLAFGFKDRKMVSMPLLMLAFLIHSSSIIPITAYILSSVIKDTKKVLMLWFLCIPLSLAAGGFFEHFFGSLGFDDRTSYLTEGNAGGDEFSHTGFRWDFLLYSASAVYAGWYFIFKRKFKDPYYHLLFKTFLIANGFWILVIRANFSNRFAYLSWFMMGLIIVYPFLKRRFFKFQHRKLVNVLIAYFIFTYLMNW